MGAKNAEKTKLKTRVQALELLVDDLLEQMRSLQASIGSTEDLQILLELHKKEIEDRRIPF